MPFGPNLMNKRYVNISPCCLTRYTRHCKCGPRVVLTNHHVGSDVKRCITRRMVGLVLGGKLRMLNSGVLVLNFAFGRGYPSIEGAGMVSVCGTLGRCKMGVRVCSP